MQIDYSRIWPYVMAALVVLLIYRRLRRSFGRQPLHPVRMTIRVVILCILACTLLPFALRSGAFLSAELVGLASGIALAVWGASQTRYQSIDGRLHYIPHTYTGIAVSLLFIGRLVFRFVALRGVAEIVSAPGMQGLAPVSMVRSPLTVGLLFVVVGYYVCYYSLVMWKSKRIGPEDLEAVGASPTGSP